MHALFVSSLFNAITKWNGQTQRFVECICVYNKFVPCPEFVLKKKIKLNTHLGLPGIIGIFLDCVGNVVKCCFYRSTINRFCIQFSGANILLLKFNCKNKYFIFIFCFFFLHLQTFCCFQLELPTKYLVYADNYRFEGN